MQGQAPGGGSACPVSAPDQDMQILVASALDVACPDLIQDEDMQGQAAVGRSACPDLIEDQHMQTDVGNFQIFEC